MTDIVSSETRSRMMSGVRAKNTRPEMQIRKALHSRGLRFRLHANALPGKPDLIFPRFRAVLLVHGCFWHGHDCQLFRWPKTNVQFWHDKIQANKVRDEAVIHALGELNWRVGTVWECAIRGSEIENVAGYVDEWLRGSDPTMEVRG